MVPGVNQLETPAIPNREVVKQKAQNTLILNTDSMTTIAEFNIPAEEFTLKKTLQQHPDIRLEIDRVVAHDTVHVTPFIWVSGKDHEELLPAFEADPSIEDVELLGEFDNESHYRMKWNDHTQIIGHMVIEGNATVQQAIAKDGKWRLRALFPERSGLSETYDFAEEQGIPLTINQVYDADSIRRVRFSLTEEQHEALTEAAKQGYYSVPRETNQSELADTLNISHQAASERLRRAYLNLIEHALLVDEDDEAHSYADS